MLALAAFAAGAAVSLLASWFLVARLERVGSRLGFSEALLGIVAALAADAPEISAAISAIVHHQEQTGAGVVLGSNVFNLAALLGLGAVVAGRLRLHRKVVVLGGAVALWVAAVCLAVLTGLLPDVAGLALAAAVLLGYIVLLGTEGRMPSWLRLPRRSAAWLRSAISEEELELGEAIRPAPARWPDVVAGAGALVVVIGASVAMERAASALGRRYSVPEIVVGGLVLAAVTSLPNAVAAVYLAARGRGAATLSTALNSNAINVVVGLLLPGTLLGLGEPSGQADLVAVWYVGLSVAALALCYRHRGLGRRAGALIITAYAAFTVSIIVSTTEAARAAELIGGLGALSAALLASGLMPAGRRRARAGISASDR